MVVKSKGSVPKLPFMQGIDRKVCPDFRHVNHVQHQLIKMMRTSSFSGGVPGSCAAKWPCFASCFGDAAEQQRGGGCSNGELHGGTTLRGVNDDH